MMRLIPGRFLLAGGLTLSATIALPADSADTQRFSAARDFQPVKTGAFADYYAETKSSNPAEHGVAIQTARQRDRPAAAELVYSGPAGTFDLTLLAVAEEDGESVYQLFVAGRDLAERQNSPQTGKRTVVSHRWQKVALETGAMIRVVFAGRTNGKIPESNATAWSRGRWRALLIDRSLP